MKSGSSKKIHSRPDRRTTFESSVRHASSCFVMLRHASSCFVMLRHASSCFVAEGRWGRPEGICDVFWSGNLENMQPVMVWPTHCKGTTPGKRVSDSFGIFQLKFWSKARRGAVLDSCYWGSGDILVVKSSDKVEVGDANAFMMLGCAGKKREETQIPMNSNEFQWFHHIPRCSSLECRKCLAGWAKHNSGCLDV